MARFFTKTKKTEHYGKPLGLGDKKGKINILPPSKGDTSRAKRLYQLLASARQITGQVVLSKWANEFRLMSKFVEPDRVDMVLSWLEDHPKKIGTKYPFKVFSAKRFRDSFMDLESDIKELKQDEYTPTPEGKKLAELLTPVWPSGSKQDLPRIAEICLVSIKVIVDKVTKIRNHWRDHYAKTRFRDSTNWSYFWYLDTRLLPQLKYGRPSEFVQWWLLTVVRPRLKDWTGKLDYFVFAIGGEVYRDYMAAWASRCGDIRFWYRLEKEMK